MNYYGPENVGYWSEESRSAYEMVVRYKEDKYKKGVGHDKP